VFTEIPISESLISLTSFGPMKTQIGDFLTDISKKSPRERIMMTSYWDLQTKSYMVISQANFGIINQYPLPIPELNRIRSFNHNLRENQSGFRSRKLPQHRFNAPGGQNRQKSSLKEHAFLLIWHSEHSAILSYRLLQTAFSAILPTGLR